jgi:hypothetical protein
VAQAGELLQLAFSETLGDDLLAATADGRSMRLMGIGSLAQQLSEGDVLLVRVLAGSPNLELEVFGTLPRSGASAPQMSGWPTEQAAMRVDQLVMRQIAWQAPDPVALAANWRALVHGRWRSEGARPASAAELLASGYGRMDATGDDEATQFPLPPQADRWTFPVYAWGGLQLMLRLVEAEDGDEGSPASRRLRRFALRIELRLPGLGRVTMQVRSIVGGIELTLAAERAEALAPLRDLVPDMAAAMTRADLRLVRCHLAHGTLPQESAPSLALQAGPAPVVAPGLFRAAAEVVVLLAGASPASR